MKTPKRSAQDEFMLAVFCMIGGFATGAWIVAEMSGACVYSGWHLGMYLHP